MRNAMTEHNLSLDALQRQLAQLEQQVKVHMNGFSRSNGTVNFGNNVTESPTKLACQKVYAAQHGSNKSHHQRPSAGEKAFGQHYQTHHDHASHSMSSGDFAKQFTDPFCEFMTKNPTVYHVVNTFKFQMKAAGWTELNERDEWKLQPSGHYFVDRNGSSLISFVVGAEYKPGNGAAVIAAHIDALTAPLKPMSKLPNNHGFVQMGVAPYADAFNSTWWDRDLGIAGRVLVQEDDKVVFKPVTLRWPIARIPTLAPHFGAASHGPFDKETQMVPIIGLDGERAKARTDRDPRGDAADQAHHDSYAGPFIATQPERLVGLVADAIGLSANEVHKIVNWDLQLFDFQPATVGGLDKEFIFAGRLDDKLCSWAAMRALLDGAVFDTHVSSIIKMVALFDNEEIGSLLRQGARSNFLPMTIERVVNSLANGKTDANTMGRTFANSFLVSADVCHAVNPNFLGQYLPQYMPELNVGLAVSADPQGHMTTDSVSATLLKRCAEKTGAQLQILQGRNGARGGGTVGPMLSSATGMRAIDAGIPQLSMHSIRATTGSLDPGLGVLAFMGFLNGYESVDKEFRL